MSNSSCGALRALPHLSLHQRVFHLFKTRADCKTTLKKVGAALETYLFLLTEGRELLLRPVLG